MFQQGSWFILSTLSNHRASHKGVSNSTRPPPTLPPNYKSQFNENHFLLSKLKSGKVKAKFIGTHMKGKLPRQLWVPKALVTHVKVPKLAWVPKPQK